MLASSQKRNAFACQLLIRLEVGNSDYGPMPKAQSPWPKACSRWPMAHCSQILPEMLPAETCAETCAETAYRNLRGSVPKLAPTSCTEIYDGNYKHTFTVLPLVRPPNRGQNKPGRGPGGTTSGSISAHGFGAHFGAHFGAAPPCSFCSALQALQS